MALHLPLFDFPGRENPTHKGLVWGVLFFSLAHVVATWGHIGVFWGDHGRWLHEVERFAQGEMPYRDYSWAFPPLALWLLGVIARIFGSGVNVIWTVTSVICVLIFLTYYRYVSLLVPHPFVPGTLASGLLLSAAYANRGSAPLPAGMYTPAAPVGFLCLLVAVVLVLNLLRSPCLSYAMGVGFFCALSVLAKQDFWVPSFYLIAVCSGVLVLTLRPPARVLALSLLTSFGLTVLIGILVVAAQSGWATVAGIPEGFGQVLEFRGRGFPSWERITVEATALTFLLLAVISCLAMGKTVSLFKLRGVIIVLLVAAIVGSIVHVSMTYRIGLRLRMDGIGLFPTPMEEFLWGSHSYERAAVHWLKHRLLEHLFPALLPATLALVVATRWKRFHTVHLRNTVIFLLGLCIAARLRRGFEYVEWYHFLLEIPCYLLVIQLCIPDLPQRTRAGVIIALLALVLMGMRSYYYLAVGPFTASRDFERVETPKGSVYLSSHEAKHYRQLHETLMHLDPSGKRPVFAFGYSGGFNYFLNRPNPTPLTLGFLSNFQPDKVVSNLLSHFPRPFLLDNAAFNPGPGDPGTGRFPSPRIDLKRWELPMGESHYSRLDRPYFVRLISSCKMVSKIPETPVTVYDCNV